MIITEYVIYRGKKKPVSELSLTSGYKVDVVCPECQQVRTVHYKSIVKAGHHVCLPCMIKKQAKILPIGKRYGKLVVIKESQKSGYSLCKCDCGQLTEVDNYRLKTGNTKSCGCLKKENFDNSIRPKGENHGMWKGGISLERQREMQSEKYKEWRNSVFKRDEYECQKCKQIGYGLNAHHIKDYSENKAERFNIKNGITLCKSCHTEFHKLYGRKNVSEKELYEFCN
jgi:hypothetical protein